MPSRTVRSRVFRSVNGPARIDADVARYYESHPLQLAHDFPEESQRRLWAHIGRVLEAVGEDFPVSTPGRGGFEETLDALENLRITGRLPGAARRRWAEREADRLLHARQLDLPEEHPVPLASEAEVRRARLKLVR